MRERTLLLGGTFQLRGRSGKGTRIRIEIPLPGERRAITAEQAKGHATDPFGKPVPDNI